MANYYDRYKKYRDRGLVRCMPFIQIVEGSNDIYIVYDKRKDRLDNLSYKYYNNPDYGWLILQANPQLGGYEFSIKDGETIRIPYPISDAISRYEKEINQYNRING